MTTPISAPTPPKTPKTPEPKPEPKPAHKAAPAPAPGRHDAPDAPAKPADVSQAKSHAPVRKLASNQHARPRTDGSAANLAPDHVAAKEGAENEGMPPSSVDTNTMSDQPGAIKGGRR